MENNDYYYCERTNSLFISANSIFEAFQARIKELTRRLSCDDVDVMIVVNRLIELNIYISASSFLCLVDDDFIAVSLNNLRCMLKNDVDVSTKIISKILTLFSDFGGKYLDCTKPKLKEIIQREVLAK